MASTVREIKKQNPDILVEVLAPDFGGDLACVDAVIDSGQIREERVGRGEIILKNYNCKG